MYCLSSQLGCLTSLRPEAPTSDVVNSMCILEMNSWLSEHKSFPARVPLFAQGLMEYTLQFLAILYGLHILGFCVDQSANKNILALLVVGSHS